MDLEPTRRIRVEIEDHHHHYDDHVQDQRFDVHTEMHETSLSVLHLIFHILHIDSGFIAGYDLGSNLNRNTNLGPIVDSTIITDRYKKLRNFLSVQAEK
ncbi:hypothetical protein EVAR_43760_1 [Eumeta japonica]|uniref:Uncharacterized protein n=1 Tax=Eumeta variegata TaxID=151549 RepID=A0A4C1XJ43_EUMVA|nr:hypothetical protein EVAR_43760_1 [Eumeta japonica]